MSTEKYTALHGGLIARKGEALPTPPVKLDMFDSALKSAAAASPPSPLSCDAPGGAAKPPRPKRIADESKSAGIKALTFRLDPALYHRVQVAAAKLGWTSQDFLRAAVEGHLAHLGREIFPNCGCISGKDGCS